MLHAIIPEIKKRSRWLWLTGALFLFVVLAAVALNRKPTKEHPDLLSTAERAWLKDHPVIRLAPDPDFPPVEYFDRNGRYQGITADYVAHIEKKLGIRIQIVHLPNWDEIISKAKSRQIDAYVATKTPQRAEYLLFTSPFLEFPVVIIAREKVKGTLTLEKLTGMKVSVVSDYAAHNFIAYNYPKVHLDLTADVQTGLRKVAFGLSDAFVENLATATYYLEKEGITNLRVVGESGYFYRMGFCTRKDWPELNGILEKGLAAISADEKEAIYKKWLSVEPRSRLTSKEVRTGFLAAFIMILLSAAGIIAWNRALARQVRLRTGELETELVERRRMEEELARARDELERRVEERTTELTETVQALRFTQFAVDRSVDQAFWITNDGQFFYVNDAACQALGYTRDELVMMSVPDIDPTCPPERVVHLWQVLHEKGTDTFETCHRAKDGRVYPVEIRSNLLVFDGKEYNCCFVTDITERKQAEEQLRKSELTQRKLACALAQKNKFMRTLIDAIPDLIFYKDCNRAYLGCNKAFEAFAGRSEKDLVGRTDLDIFSRDVADAFREMDLEILSTEESRRNEEWIDYPDGRRVLLETLKTPFFDLDGEILGVVGVSRDITEQKRAIAELELAKFLVDKAAIGIHRISEEGKILYANEYTCRTLGYTPEELCSMTVFDIDPTFNHEAFRDHRKTTQASGSRTFESRHLRKDGSTFPVEITVTYLESQDKEQSINVSFVKDITERKRADEALLLSQFCIDKAGIGIYQSDEAGTIFNVNEHACKSLGYSSEELCAISVFDIDPEITREKMLELKEILDEGGPATFQTTHQRRDSTTFPVEITANVLDFRGKRYGISFVKDITERKRAEEALRESESSVRRKLESILDPEGDIGELDLADILDAPQIQSFMENLYRITGHKMSIIDLKGQVLVDVGWQDICSKFHRMHPETLKKCLESDSDLTIGIPQGEFRTYRCKNNMWHLVTPIIVGGRHMGNLFMGQFFFAGEEIDYDLFRAQARKYGFPEEEYIAALEAVPRQSEELVNMGKAIFLGLTDMFSRLSYANIKLAHSLAERDKLTETLSKANLVVEHSPVVLFRWKGDDAWPVELVSGNIIQFGYTPDEFLSGAIAYSSILHPDDLERVTREVHEFCNDGAGQFRLEYRIRTKGGEIRWVNEHSNIERDAAGGVKNFEGIIIDVTERKRAEDAIRASREKYQALVDSFDGLIYISSRDYRIEFMNRKLIERTGRDAVGEYCYKVIHDVDSVCAGCVNDRVFAGETVHREIFSPKDNRWYYAVNIPIRSADGRMSKHTMIIDITERKLSEEELQRQKQLLEDLNETLELRVEEEVAKNREKDVMLIQQNRQAALGEMLDHIAHQWKQPLTSLSLVIQDLGETASTGGLTPEFTKETVCITMALLDHMAQTMDVFRGFYRPDKEKKVFNIKESIDQALAFIAPALSFHSIAVELDADPGLAAFGYPKEYAQVLLNILANARDVFRARGTANPRVIIRAFADGARTVVTVTDNAGGIPETIIDKIFDFYFTTNESSDGSGIGLYMSKNIIEKNMGGTLSAANTGSGAQFRIEVKVA
ncbi:MAG: PAS domain S-box protein [Deltaproteobacteria bacterium]|nr:PAS domain S-box protein [Deltaproteobacteria bacterium]TLN02107.1 MAG: PAS domain S-box protein [bacterium]